MKKIEEILPHDSGCKICMLIAKNFENYIKILSDNHTKGSKDSEVLLLSGIDDFRIGMDPFDYVKYQGLLFNTIESIDKHKEGLLILAKTTDRIPKEILLDISDEACLKSEFEYGDHAISPLNKEVIMRGVAPKKDGQYVMWYEILNETAGKVSYWEGEINLIKAGFVKKEKRIVRRKRRSIINSSTLIGTGNYCPDCGGLCSNEKHNRRF